MEINESERIKEKRIKRNEDNLRDLQDNIKRYNIRIIGVSEEEDKKKDHEKILEEIIVENFPKMGKEITKNYTVYWSTTFFFFAVRAVSWIFFQVSTYRNSSILLIAA